MNLERINDQTPPSGRETDNPSIPNKKQEKRRQWRAKYLQHLSLKQIKSEIEEVERAKKSADSGPLYQYLEGVLIDEEEKELFIHLRDQKEKSWLQLYEYILPDAIQIWESNRKSFKLCQKDNSKFKAYTFEDLKARDEREKQKKKKRSRGDEEENKVNQLVEDPSLQDKSDYSECFPVSSSHQSKLKTKQTRKNLYKQEIALRKGESISISSNHQSKLKTKQTRKNLDKQEIALRKRNPVKALEFFYKEIGCGKEIDEVGQEWARENDGTIPVILFINRPMLEDWRDHVEEAHSKSRFNIVFDLSKLKMKGKVDFKDQYIKFFYEEIAKGRAFHDLVRGSMRQKDGKIQRILHANWDNLFDWEDLVSKAKKRTPNSSQNFELPPISKEDPNFEEKYLEFFYEKIGKGTKFDDLVRWSMRQKDGKIQRVLHANKNNLLGWEELVSETLEETSVSFLKFELPPISTGNQTFEKKCLESSYEEIRKGITFYDLVRGSIVQKDMKIQRIFHANKNNLLDWEDLVYKTLRITSVSSQNFELPSISKEDPNFEEKCLEFSYEKIGKGTQFYDLVRKSIEQRDWKIQRIFRKNERELSAWNRLVSETLTRTSASPLNFELPPISKEDPNFEETCLESLFEKIGKGTKFYDLVKKSIVQKDWGIQRILQKNEGELLTWNRLVSETLTRTSASSLNFELLQMSQGNQNFEKKCLKFFIKETRNGKKFPDLVRGCIDLNEGKIQRIFTKNQLRVQYDDSPLWTFNV